MPKSTSLLDFFFPAILGFASGLPLMLVGSTLQAWGTEGHLNLMSLGYLSLIGQPYAFKFLWAPFVDRYRMPFWKGHRRGWILTLLPCLAFIFYMLSLSQLPNGLCWFVTWAAMGALFSATLDISIDAYRTELFPSKEYGYANACYVSAYRIGMVVSGGLALILAAEFGWARTYQSMGALLLVVFVCFLFSKENFANASNKIHLNWKESLVNPLKNLLQRPYILCLLLFILLYKFGEAMGTALSTTFLLRELHFSLIVLGGTYKTVGIVSTILGAFIGGWFYKKYTLYGTLFWFGVLQALGILWYVALARVGQSLPLMLVAVSFEALTAGMATTVFLALLMRLCHAPYTATHFALLSACASVGRIFTGPLASLLTKNYGWSTYFLLSFFSCIPALILLRWLKPKLHLVVADHSE